MPITNTSVMRFVMVANGADVASMVNMPPYVAVVAVRSIVVIAIVIIATVPIVIITITITVIAVVVIVTIIIAWRTE